MLSVSREKNDIFDPHFEQFVIGIEYSMQSTNLRVLKISGQTGSTMEISF